MNPPSLFQRFRGNRPESSHAQPSAIGSPPQTPSRGLSLWTAFDALWLTALSIYILLGVPLVPLHGDEATQIAMGRDTFYHLAGDHGRVLYQPSAEGEAAAEQDLRLRNGTVMKYLYGAVAAASGYRVDELNEQWVWGAGWDWNHENGHVPPQDLLLRARYLSAIVLCGSVIALYAIARLTVRQQGRVLAVVATLAYVSHPAVVLHGRLAMMEGGMLFTSLLVVLAGILLLREPTPWRAILLAVLSGIAVATKHTNVFVVTAMYIALGLYFLTNRYQPRRTRTSVAIVVTGLLSIIVFIGLNPAWWSAPFERARDVLEDRRDLLAGQVEAFGGYENFEERAFGWWNQVLIGAPMYADTTVDGFLSEQQTLIDTYEGSGLAGWPRHPHFLLWLWITFMGISGLALITRYNLKRGAPLVFSVWTSMILLLTLFLTPLEWQRYYLPMIPLVSLLGPLGFLWSIQVLRIRQIEERSANVSATG